MNSFKLYCENNENYSAYWITPTGKISPPLTFAGHALYVKQHPEEFFIKVVPDLDERINVAIYNGGLHVFITKINNMMEIDAYSEYSLMKNIDNVYKLMKLTGIPKNNIYCLITKTGERFRFVDVFS